MAPEKQQPLQPIVQPEMTPMTPEQEAEIDRLVDQGLNYTQARTRAGVQAVKRTVSLESDEEQLPEQKTQGATPPPSKKPKKIDRRNLSPRGKLLADEPPAHIKRPYPYTNED